MAYSRNNWRFKARQLELDIARLAQENVMAEVATRPPRTPEQRAIDLERGYRTMFNPDAEIIPVPDPLPEATHSAQQVYLDYLQRREGRTETGQELQDWINRNRPEFPYGRSKHTDPKTGKKKWLPVQGPANWSELWSDFKSIGEDFRNPIEDSQQLLQEKMDALDPTTGKLRNIHFIQILGLGSFGKVWQVTADQISSQNIGAAQVEIVTPVELACKVVRLNPEQIDLYHANDFDSFVNYDMQTRILNDMQVLKDLKNVNICQLVDVIHIPDSITGFPFAAFCIFMDLCDADLFTLLEQQHPPYFLSEVQSLLWFRQIAKGLQYLHSCNVVHLDIKPENILYKANPNNPNEPTFKLCDFGMAMAFAYNNDLCTFIRTGGNIGTLEYQAPELVNPNNPFANPLATKPCDIYCLAATLVDTLLGYEFLPQLLAISHMPHITPNMLVTHPANPDISDDVKNLIVGMIANDPNTRLKIDAVLAHDWLN